MLQYDRTGKHPVSLMNERQLFADLTRSQYFMPHAQDTACGAAVSEISLDDRSAITSSLDGRR